MHLNALRNAPISFPNSDKEKVQVHTAQYSVAAKVVGNSRSSSSKSNDDADLLLPQEDVWSAF